MRLYPLIATALLGLCGVPACSKTEARRETPLEPSPDTTGTRGAPVEVQAQPAASAMPTATTRTTPETTPETTAPKPREAKAEFKAAKPYKLAGTVRLSETPNGVEIDVEVKDAPAGTKGIHIHEKPDCSNIAGASMGKHFNPSNVPHGLPAAGSEHSDTASVSNDERQRGHGLTHGGAGNSASPSALTGGAGMGTSNARHLGDLGNITIGKDGNGKLHITVPGANLKPGDALSFEGRAVVIHTSKDVGATAQPAGNSGTPIACAEIKLE